MNNLLDSIKLLKIALSLSLAVATTASAQPLPPDYSSAKNRATVERAAAERAAAARRKADAERQRRETAEANATAAAAEVAELARQLVESNRQAAGLGKTKVGAGKTTPAYAPLEVFHDRLSDGTMGPQMIVIPAGEFQMGSDEYTDGQPIHTVRIATPFALSRIEVTQSGWRHVMGNNPSGFNECDYCPVENVSWSDAQTYLKKLSELTGQNYRLPSESEWEYAARAGSNYQYSGSDDPEAVAWYDKNSGGKTHRVAQKMPNKWGLYDMSGNVWEWVEDAYHANYYDAPTDGSAWVKGGKSELRVLRGGSGMSSPKWTRATPRTWLGTMRRDDFTGFRPARTLP